MTDIDSDPIPRSLYNTSPGSDSCSTTLSMADRLETMYNTNSPPLDCPPPKKRKVNFSLTLDIKQETVSDDACVPQGHEVSDVESYYSDLPILPTTPHGGPQVPPLTPGTNLKVGGGKACAGQLILSPVSTLLDIIRPLVLTLNLGKLPPTGS